MVFVGHPGKTPTDLTALAAEMKAAPDKHTYSTSGLGAMGHLASASFNNRVGVKAVVVTYRGTAPALTDVIGGQTTLMVAPSAAPCSKSGRQPAGLRDYVGARRRSRRHIRPRRQGSQGLSFTLGHGLWGPKGMPTDLVTQINAAVQAA